MSIETPEDLEGIRAAGHAVGVALRKMREYAKVGMSTKELDEYGYTILKEFGANPAPKKDYDFPGYTCISINDEVCHGIPAADRILKEGDLVNIDVSAELNGYYGDNGGSFILGEDLQGLGELVKASQEILYEAIEKVKASVKIQDIGGLIEKAAKKRGYKVIRNICGHGIGRKLHEAPEEIPCYRDRYNRERLRKNTVIALETFISTKAKFVYEAPDGWTLMTKDKSFVAQHEHTLIITDGYPEIVTKENGI
jgi:methionyl aminopeptidase